MVALASGVNNLTGRSKVQFGACNSVFRLVFAFCLALSLVVATSGLTMSAVSFQTTDVSERAPAPSDEAAPCENGFICSVFALTYRLGGTFSDADFQELVISLDRSFQRFSPPNVDLPPPRTT